MLNEVIEEIRKDLKAHIGHTKGELMEKYITERLNQCLSTYYKSLNSAVSYLQNREPVNLTKRLNRGLK